jgi:thiopeptide-type bacteriocin biosynthesis protein
MVLFDFIVLRSPVENINNVFNLPKNLQPTFREGLYLASKDFYTQLEKISYLSEEEKNRIKSSLLKYWIRASIRCTPFGTFAGSTIIYLTDKSDDIVLNEAKYHNRKIRLDMGYFAFLISEIEKLPIIQDQILLFVNNSIYETPLDLRYTEAYTSNYQKDYKLSSVEKSEYLSFILEKARKGATIKDLSHSLASFAEVEFDEAYKFIIELWDSNLLISNLEPCVTGPEPLENLLLVLTDYIGIDELKKQLTQLFNHLNNPQEDASHYIEAEAIIRKLFPVPESFKNFVQTDLFLSCKKSETNKAVIESIVNQIKDLMSMSRIRTNTEIDSFKKRFIERYENKTIPLAIAIDADLGIGYAGIDDISGTNPLIDDITYKSTKSGIAFTDDIQNYISSKHSDYTKGDNECIEITENEIKSLWTDAKKEYWPNSLYIHGALVKSGGVLNNDNFLFNLMSIGGPSAGNLLGRFTQGNEELLELTRSVLHKEEQDNPDIIFAELVHLPQARTGNVLLRPVLREHEIPYVGKSGAPTNKQLLISDLYVCVRNDQIILISKKLNKRIIPRLTTAHNFHFGSLPIYKFLCDLQYQNISVGPNWDWGHLEHLKYLPRVIYKNIIVKKARWKVETSDIDGLPELKCHYINFFTEFNLVRKIPHRVLLVESDNQILIDFEQLDSILIFLSYLKKNKSVSLEEFIFTSANCIVKNKHGESHTNEIIIPVHNLSDVSQKLKTYTFKQSAVDEKYYPGSEWLFFKIFCSTNTIDKLLVQYVLPFVVLNKEKGLFDKFFFIRYKEHGSHLRIRFYNKDIFKHNDVLLAFTTMLKPLLENDIIQRIVIDTYIPETDRYGGPETIRISEELFENDSWATLKILNLLEPGVQDNLRILISMRSVDALLNDFKLPIRDKRDLFKKLSEGFATEFGAGPLLQKNLNGKYKNLSRSIFSFMDPDQDPENEMLEAAEIIRTRSTDNLNMALTILKIIEKHEDAISLNELLISHIHMMMNRLFISHQRKYELVVYHFLERYYTSVLHVDSKTITRIRP